MREFAASTGWDPYRQAWPLYLYEREGPIGHGEISVVTEVTVEKVQRHTVTPPTPIELSREGVQSLMDDLWTAGIRPANFQDTSAEVAAVRQHLSDMRALAFSFKPKRDL